MFESDNRRNLESLSPSDRIFFLLIENVDDTDIVVERSAPQRGFRI